MSCPKYLGNNPHLGDGALSKHCKEKKSLEHAGRDDYDIDMSQQVIDSRRPHT